MVIRKNNTTVTTGKTTKIVEESIPQGATELPKETLVVEKGDIKVKNYKQDKAINEDLVILGLGKNSDKVKLKEKPHSNVCYVKPNEETVERYQMELKVDLDKVESPERLVAYRYNEVSETWTLLEDL